MDTISFLKWFFMVVLMVLISNAGIKMTISNPENHPIIFAFSLAWFISMIVAGVTREIFLKMDPLRFQFAQWEREGKVYEWLGVAAFRWLLLHTPLGWLNPWAQLKAGRSGIDQLLREMNYAEGAHLIGGVITLVLAFAFTSLGFPKVGLALIVVTIPLHIYPVMLQRINRGRIQKLVQRIKPVAITIQSK